MNRRLAVVAPLVALAWWWFRPFRAAVAGPSMRPELEDGDFVLAVRSRRLRRGDVVVVRRPDGLEVVKRLVGLPGERVRVATGRVAIDGSPLDEPHAHGDGPAGEWRLGADEHLVLGDDRSRSTDGRAFGPVGARSVVGVVRLRYWPRPRLV